MLPLLLTLITSAADPEITLVERTTLGVSTQAGAQLRAKLKLALEQVGLSVAIAPDSCADRDCLVAQSKLHAGCVVGVSLVKNKKGLTVDLEAVKEQAVVLQQTFLLMPNEVLDKSPDAQVFAHQLQSRLAKDRPVAAETRPVEEKDKPRLAPTEITETKPEWVEPSSPSRAPVVLAGVSAGVGAIGIGLIIVSAVVKGGLDSALQQQPVVTTINRAQAQQQADTSNALMTAGLIGLGLGLAGGATALGMGLSAAEPQ